MSTSLQNLKGFYTEAPQCPQCLRNDGTISQFSMSKQGQLVWWLCIYCDNDIYVPKQSHFTFCPLCKGTGFVWEEEVVREPCTCNGKGWVRI